MTDELIEQITQIVESKSWRVYREQKAERIAELCKAHYRKIAVDAVRADSNSRMTEYTIEAINKALE